jgi:hypothetical protein
MRINRRAINSTLWLPNPSNRTRPLLSPVYSKCSIGGGPMTSMLHLRCRLGREYAVGRSVGRWADISGKCPLRVADNATPSEMTLNTDRAEAGSDAYEVGAVRAGSSSAKQ